MDLVDVARIAFAAAALIAVGALVAAILDRAPQSALRAMTAAIGAIMVAAWVAVGFRPELDAAVAAGGITAAFAVALSSVKLGSLVAASGRVDDQLARARARLTSLVAREAEERGVELERTLARARADSISLLAEQERRIAEERRRAAAEREQEAGSSLAEALASAQAQVERRLGEWRDDLDRAQRGVATELERLAQRQRQLISEAELRIATNAERLEGDSEQQRQSVVRLREELARVTQEAVATASQELETFGAERRRALHELNERMRKRERALGEQIEREEAEAAARIQASLADVERRQVEQLERMMSRTTASYSEAAGQQFADAIRSAREDAAARLSRELDRAVQTFAREAEAVLAERLAHVGDQGAQRVEKRLSQAMAGLERQRAEAVGLFEERLGAAEQELRRRVETLTADTEAERAVLEARLSELGRRIDETYAKT